MNRTTLILLGFLLASCTATAQNLVDSRSQAEGWYVPVNGAVTANGAKARELDVKLYLDNQLVSEVTAKKGKFHLELDLNNAYTLILSKEGYEPKVIQVDTHVPDQLVKYPGYNCFVDLEPSDKFAHSDPFYLDFPGALVSWHPEQKGFYHSTGYLADIQSKVAMLQAQIVP
jgi:hypothetical protein